jgi:hypothetical protein
MATYGSIRRLCDRHNQVERRVREVESTLAPATFWARAQGNFAITMGSEGQRVNALCDALEALRRQVRGPIVVLNRSVALEQELLRRAQQNQVGRVFPVSRVMRNYDLFFGMEPYKIREIFIEIARMQGTLNVGPLRNYVSAFLEIVARGEPIRLASMLRYAAYTDTELVAYGRSAGVSAQQLDVIQHELAGGQDMRTILRDIQAAFEGITTADCRTGCSLSSERIGNSLVLIRDQSPLTDIFHLCLVKELEVLMQRGSSMAIILNDVDVNRTNQIERLLQRAHTYGNVRLGICSQNLWSMAMGAEQQENVLSSTQSWMIFHGGSERPDDLNHLLESFGSYEYWYPSLGGGAPETFLDQIANTHWEVAMANRLRVRPQDAQRYGLLVTGHQGDMIELYAGVQS